MKRILQVAALSLITWSAAANSELDPQAKVRPSALVVREDAQGNKVAFKTNIAEAVKSDDAAAAALSSLKVENVIKPQSSELDEGTSTEAWYYYPYNYGYGYNYNHYNYGYGYPNYYYGYRYNYQYTYYYYPTYNYYYGGYRYWYYYCY